MTEISLHGMRFEVAAFSEQGPRTENQDAFSTDTFEKGALLAVADGMGGEKSGRVAADAALETLRKHTPIQSLESARRAVREADRAVSSMSDGNPELYGGMGCALGVLSFVSMGDGPGFIGAHVGDVRILSRSPDGVIRLETRDHTPAFTRWEAGEISLDEIPDSAGANRLQRAVGRGGEADVTWLPARPGWSWLIISDGIYKAMRLDELASAMMSSTASATGEAIRKKVEERGADDNFTAVYVRALGAPGTAIPHVKSSEPMTGPTAAHQSRGASGIIGTVLALAALALAGFAFFTARNAENSAARSEQVQTLQAQVDSLAGVVRRLQDPFGPAAPSAGPAAAGAGPASQTPQPTQPR